MELGDQDQDLGRAMVPSPLMRCYASLSRPTRGILNTTHVIFRMVKEGMMEIIEERLRSFRAKIVAGQVGARTPSFR